MGSFYPQRVRLRQERNEPYTGKKKTVGIDLSPEVVDYFKGLAEETGLPAIPVAFTETRDKLQRTRQQGDLAAQGVQRKRYAPLGEVVHFHGKGHVRQQATKSP